MSTAKESSNRRSRDAETQLTPCEFEIMEVLWERDSATVRDVHSALRLQRPLAYTTVMTVMDKLFRKGALTQKRKGRAYVYRARVSRGEVIEQRIDYLVRYYFQGSYEDFLTYIRGRFETAEKEEPHLAVIAPQPEIDTALL